MKIRTSDLQRALAALRDLPPKDPQISVAAAAEQLAPVVRDLRTRGYSPDDIAAHLARLGVPLSAYALKRVAGVRKHGERTSLHQQLAPASQPVEAVGGSSDDR